MAEPTVRFLGDVEAGWKALSVWLTYDLPVRALRPYWTISKTGEPHGPNGGSPSGQSFSRKPHTYRIVCEDAPEQ
jgi:hypothetical protein